MTNSFNALLLCEETGLGGIQTTISLLQQQLKKHSWEITRLAVRNNRPHLLQLLRQAIQADILIASNNFMPAYWVFLLSILTRRPSVIWVHGPISDVLEKAHASNRKKAWLRWIYKRANLLVCASETSRQSLLRFMGQVSVNTTVVHNPCSAPQSSDTKADECDIHTPPSNDCKRLGFVGRLSAEKNPLKLLQALRCLPEAYQLEIIGDGPLMSAMREQSKDLIASGQLRLLGSLQATTAHYQSWCATLLCSEYEGYPMTALESLACGTPCVSTPIPALQEMLATHASYMLADNHSPEALVQAIVKTLATSPEKRQQDMNAIVLAHTPEQFAHSWSKLLHTTIKS